MSASRRRFRPAGRAGAVVPAALVASAALLAGCGGEGAPGAADAGRRAADRAATRADGPPPEPPAPRFRSVEAPASYVGDAACGACHEAAAAAWEPHAMARSFHRWTSAERIETTLETPLRHATSGFHYAVVEEDGALYQEELLLGPGGRRLHELRRRMDWVMGSGAVARTYFTEENGRLFQLPLTWYAEEGWDFSPGYEVNNARFGRLLPDRCLACHGSYPEALPSLEGKYAELAPGIGCERCHGPGSLHVDEREAEAAAGVPAASVPAAGTDASAVAGTGSTDADEYDDTIVNPARLPLSLRLDVCEQCHVHTPVTVLREGRGPFDFVPSERLSDHAAFFKTAGSIDVVSHADRLRQSACFAATRAAARPLECATCHEPHAPAERAARNAPCLSCHAAGPLAGRVSADARADHGSEADCVRCHMPTVAERTVPHGTFTDHWIRVVEPDAAPPEVPRTGEGPLEPYFERDRTGQEADVYRAMGRIVYATLAGDPGALAAGAGALERLLEPDGARADARFLLGVARQQLGQPEQAIEALEASLAIEPERPRRLHALARAYERAGRPAEAALALYERALALQPALAFVRADYADLLRAEGRLDEAEAAYRDALAERPGLPVAAFNLGALLAGRGRLPEAADAFRTAVRLDPTLAEALSPLLQIRTSGAVVSGVRVMGSPLERLPVRGRGPGAVRPIVEAAPPALRFANVPPGAVVRIVEPEGGLVRALAPAEGASVRWDLEDARGRAVPGGLYRVRVSDPGGGPEQTFFLGIVRLGG